LELILRVPPARPRETTLFGIVFLEDLPLFLIGSTNRRCFFGTATLDTAHFGKSSDQVDRPETVSWLAWKTWNNG
jgi:hypothetical protein